MVAGMVETKMATTMVMCKWDEGRRHLRAPQALFTHTSLRGTRNSTSLALRCTPISSVSRPSLFKTSVLGKLSVITRSENFSRHEYHLRMLTMDHASSG